MQNHQTQKMMNNWSTYWIIGIRGGKNKRKISGMFYMNVPCRWWWWPFCSGITKVKTTERKNHHKRQEREEKIKTLLEPTYVYHSRLSHRFTTTIGNHLFYIVDRFFPPSVLANRNVCIHICDLMLLRSSGSSSPSIYMIVSSGVPI